MPPALASGTRVLRPALQLSCLASRWLRMIFAFAMLIASGVTGCAKSPSSSFDIVVRREIKPQPVRVGSAELTLRLTDPAGKKITGAQIAFEADMSHPGMSPVFGQAKEVEPGRYQGRMDIGMAGDWVVFLHITLANGQRVDRQIDMRDVRPN
jgi:YtkA-like